MKVSWKVNPTDKRHNDFDIYGVTALRNGVLFTEGANKDTLGEMHYGAGIGFKPWKYKYLPSLGFMWETSNYIQGSLVFSFGK